MLKDFNGGDKERLDRFAKCLAQGQAELSTPTMLVLGNMVEKIIAYTKPLLPLGTTMTNVHGCYEGISHVGALIECRVEDIHVIVVMRFNETGVLTVSGSPVDDKSRVVSRMEYSVLESIEKILYTTGSQFLDDSLLFPAGVR